MHPAHWLFTLDSVTSPIGSAELDQTSLALLKLELEAGEQLLWIGKPRWFRDRMRWGMMAIVLLLCMSFLFCFRVVFPQYRWAAAAPTQILYFVVTVAVSIRTSYNRDRDSLFGLTDRRAIRMWPVHSVSYLDESGKPVRIRRRLFGRVTIGDTNVSARYGNPRWIAPRRSSFLDFFAIAYVDDVLRIALGAQGKEIESRGNRPAA